MRPKKDADRKMRVGNVRSTTDAVGKIWYHSANVKRLSLSYRSTRDCYAVMHRNWPVNRSNVLLSMRFDMFFVIALVKNFKGTCKASVIFHMVNMVKIVNIRSPTGNFYQEEQWCASEE